MGNNGAIPYNNRPEEAPDSPREKELKEKYCKERQESELLKEKNKERSQAHFDLLKEINWGSFQEVSHNKQGETLLIKVYEDKSCQIIIEFDSDYDRQAFASFSEAINWAKDQEWPL
jgi:hypothetical protein